MTGEDSKEHFNFNAWIMQHNYMQEILVLQFSGVIANKNGVNKAFKERRNKELNNVLDTINKFLMHLNNRIMRIRKQLEKECEKFVPVAHGFIFDDQKDNMKIRIASFMHHKMQRTRMKILNEDIVSLCGKVMQAKQLIFLLSNNLVPEQCTIQIKEKFFNIDSNPRLVFKFQALQSAVKIQEEEIEMAAKPLWLSSFRNFLFQLVQNALDKIDKELFYFVPLQGEVSLSRYLFCINTQLGRVIDNFIISMANAKFKSFSEEIIPFCNSLLPSSYMKNTSFQSTALLLYYRVIMDRVYEKYPHVFDPTDNYSVQWKLTDRDVTSFTFPSSMLPSYEKGLSVRTVFSQDINFKEAASIFTSSFFVTNTIDALYYIHCGMVIIHKGAITNLIGHDPNTAEIKKLLGFDDLFSLLVGTMMASDIPDFQQLGNSSKMFTPKSCLSPLLEYANSNLEAFVMHCMKPADEI